MSSLIDCEDGVFNHYNTEVIKFDSNNWHEVGELLEPPKLDPAYQLPINRFSIDRESDEEVDEMLRPRYALDSLNVRLQLILILNFQSLNQQKVLTPILSLTFRYSNSNPEQNKSFTDVTFIVGPPQHSKKYVGHRVLLAMTSPVFETMFYGDMADKNKYIRIPDVAPIGFENLLRYAYTDSLNLNSVEDAMLTAYAAKKYLLPQLLLECLSHIEHNISPSTACVVFEFAHVLNSQQLVLQAMNLIDRQTLAVITNKSFNHVQASTVEFLSNRKYLNLNSEYSLFKSILCWSLAEAKRRNIEPDDWNSIRTMLSENSIFGAFRFLAFSQEEFAKSILKSSTTIAASGTTAVAAAANEGSSDPSAVGNESRSNLDAASSSAETATTAAAAAATSGGGNKTFQVDVFSSNSLLTEAEQRAVFLNLALNNNIAILPSTLNSLQRTREAPPEFFTLKRFRSSSSSSSSSLQIGGPITTTTSTRSIKTVSSKFQCLSENVFIVALTIPIRLDPSSYINKTPKFDCHLKFTTKATGGSTETSASPSNQANDSQTAAIGATSSGEFTLMMDTIDESLQISIAREKDCFVRLKRPILIRMGNINELTLTFQSYALDEDVVVLRTPKSRLAATNYSEQIDGENISWFFYKNPTSIEFSEIHYYY